MKKVRRVSNKGANSAMSRIGAVVNKMMQINGKVIIINYFVVLLDVL